MPTRKRVAPPEKEDTDPWATQEPTSRRPVQRVPVARPPRRHALEVIQGPGAPRLIPLEDAELVLGRAPDCAVQLDSQEVSRRHARLVRADGEYTCEDLQSQNGLYLNGVKVHSAVLRDEDQLQLGDVVLVYHGGG
jgi:pSer/pThr/pTyr-binding forkhead associated (FHA) protein